MKRGVLIRTIAIICCIIFKASFASGFEKAKFYEYKLFQCQRDTINIQSLEKFRIGLNVGHQLFSKNPNPNLISSYNYLGISLSYKFSKSLYLGLDSFLGKSETFKSYIRVNPHINYYLRSQKSSSIFLQLGLGYESTFKKQLVEYQTINYDNDGQAISSMAYGFLTNYSFASLNSGVGFSQRLGKKITNELSASFFYGKGWFGYAEDVKHHLPNFSKEIGHQYSGLILVNRVFFTL